MDVPSLPVFCINLDHRTDRWEKTQATFANTCLANSIVRFPAIKAEKGVHGCRLSHFAVIQQAKDQGLPWVGIMEDDCAPYPHFNVEFPKLLNMLWTHRDIWTICNTGPIDIKYIRKLKPQFMKIDCCTCTQFVIINASIYDKLLNSWIQGVSEDGVDHYYKQQSSSIVTWVPLLTYQFVSESDVQKGYNIGETDEFQKAYNYTIRML